MLGGTYFFTVNLPERNRRLLVEHIGLLRAAFGAARAVRPFEVIAAVVLLDHLRSLLPSERRSPRRMVKVERGIWQRRFWGHLVRDERDLAAHADYVHFNPVKHAHVERVVDWPYSTFHRYVAWGDPPPDWGDGVEAMVGFGERTRKAGF